MTYIMFFYLSKLNIWGSEGEREGDGVGWGGGGGGACVES